MAPGTPTSAAPLRFFCGDKRIKKWDRILLGRRIWLRVLLTGWAILLSLLLSSCTTLQLPSAPPAAYQKETWPHRYQVQSRILQWTINGAFSIKQPNKTVIAAYQWQQQADRQYSISIHSSLGLSSVTITGTPGALRLCRSAHDCDQARTPEQLMQKQLNWALPVSHLYYWIRGIPAPSRYPSHYKASFDAYGHLTTLDQNGWHIRFFQYRAVDSVDLPRAVELNNRQFTLKIVIKRWEVN